ncbi:hypothetical protein GLV94_08275 [Virgibacillus halodenitrificans]|uniref:hypothetical protein n=1 Tax=Virgibacillus halodenitrificans TaxID=1482 RepID=UPI001367E688|nr:hypothetical protein [Virgibacillus halodenitrificans]MYL45640.1 hypothetical protein [Virgibacillus halodenitrificans]
MRKKRTFIWGIGAVIALILIYLSVMTWYYPLSSFSIHKSYKYKPGKILYNDKTYGEIVNAFKKTYEKELVKEFESKGRDLDLTVVKTEYILPLFKQEWLLGTNSVTIKPDKLENMLFEVQHGRDIMLQLLADENYTKEQGNYLLASIKNLLHIEDSIRNIRDEKFITRKELKNSIRNLRGDFRDGFRFYVNPFYESTR